MIRKLVRHGDELVLILDASILDALNIDESTALSLSIEGHELRLAPVAPTQIPQSQFEKLHDSISERYAKTFKRLAEES